MNRLQSEVHRLYVPQAPAGQPPEPANLRLIDDDGRVRAMVLELARPADWSALSKVWNGVQLDLDLPAPAIAVSGGEGYQLWFSLGQPVAAPQARTFLESLRLRYLGDIQPKRLALLPALEASSRQWVHAAPVPALLADGGRWSAFVAPDLAPVFAEEPWLDLPPNPEGQASLLSHLASIQAEDFQRALDQLTPAPAAAQPRPAPEASERTVAGVEPVDTSQVPGGPWREPKSFLIAVMNDEHVALALRIEAAKALRPYFEEPLPQGLRQSQTKAHDT